MQFSNGVKLVDTCNTNLVSDLNLLLVFAYSRGIAVELSLSPLFKIVTTPLD